MSSSSSTALSTCEDIGCKSLATVRCCKINLCLRHVHCTKHAAHPSLWKVTNPTEHAKQATDVDKFIQKVTTQLEADLQTAQSREDAGVGAGAAAGSNRKRKFTPLDESASAPLVALPSKRSMAADAAAKPRMTMEELRLRTIEEARAKEISQQVAKAQHQTIISAPAATASSVAAAEPEEMDIDEDPYARRKSTGSRPMWMVGSSTGGSSSSSSASQPNAIGATAEHNARDREQLRASMTAAAWDTALSAPGGTRGTVVALLAKALQAGRDIDAHASDDTVKPSSSSASALDSSAIQQAASRELAQTLASLTPQALHSLAVLIEAAVYEAHPAAADSADASDEGSSTGALSIAYKDRSRAIMHALREPRNMLLRSRVFSGDLAPYVLATCPTDDLAPPEEQAARSALSAPVRGDLGGNWLQASYRCDNCGSHDTEYQPVAGQRDIRKAEVWGTGDSGNVAFSVRCKNCGSEWHRENI